MIKFLKRWAATRRIRDKLHRIEKLISILQMYGFYAPGRNFIRCSEFTLDFDFRSGPKRSFSISLPADSVNVASTIYDGRLRGQGKNVKIYQNIEKGMAEILITLEEMVKRAIEE